MSMRLLKSNAHLRIALPANIEPIESPLEILIKITRMKSCKSKSSNTESEKFETPSRAWKS